MLHEAIPMPKEAIPEFPPVNTISTAYPEYDQNMAKVED